jgi:hypothetical protein
MRTTSFAAFAAWPLVTLGIAGNVILFVPPLTERSGGADAFDGERCSHRTVMAITKSRIGSAAGEPVHSAAVSVEPVWPDRDG